MNDSPEQNSGSDTPSEQLPGRHSQPYIAQQLDYDRELQQLVINQVLIEKIQQKIKQLPDNDPFTRHKAEYQLTRLQERCQALQDYIDHVLRIHDQIDPYPAYKEDLELNKAILAQRKIDYQEGYQALGLLTDAEGQSLPPRQWSLEGDIGPIRPYYPQVTRPVASYPQAEQLQTVVTSMRFHNYSYTSFCYADDGTVLQDRFVLYWSFERDARAESQSSSRAIYRPSQLNAAVTASNGWAKRLSTIALKDINLSGEGYYSRRYQLERRLFPNGINRANDPHSSTISSNSDIKLYKATGFFAYPLDQGPFISQPLPKLAEVALPAYASLAESATVVTELGSQPAPKNIYVHCTLPEWNHRLRKALSDLQEQINEYNVVVGPHLQKMNTLAKMQEMLELHTTHPYDPIDKDEGLRREELSRLFSELHQGIGAIVQTPTGDNNTTFPYYQEKQHIDLCAKALWKLISSKALYAELDHYIEHIEQLDLEEGEMPPGPYMAEEENWYEIFITLAECYAALSSSDIYADLVWKEDIVHGINSLGKMEMALKGDQEMAKIFEDIAASLRDVEDSLDEVGLPEYLDRQEGSFSGVEYPPEPTQSLFNLIITKYEALAKPFVSNLVPGPGAPCTLQVILCCYQDQLMRHTLNRIKSDMTYHLRYFKNVLYVLTVVNGRTGLGKLDTIDLRDILKALLVTRDHRASNGRAVNALDTLGKWLAGIDEGDEHSTSERGYQRVLNSRLGNAATYGKALYSTFNLVLSIQYLQALEEKAAEEGWSEDRIVLEYINAFSNMALSMGTTTAALLNVARRVKYLGFSQAVQKGLTGKIHARLAGGILDRIALPLSFVQGILSAYQAVDHLQEGEMKQAMMTTIAGTANIALSAGFIMRTVAKRLASRP